MQRMPRRTSWRLLTWPDAEGDAALNAFNVALSRLRKLLGDAQALQQRDGRLVLDGERVWTDIAALQRLAERVDDAQPAQDALALADRLLEVYRGPFLADHPAPWSAACRQRQAERLGRAMARLIERLQRDRQHAAAERLRERWRGLGAEADAGAAQAGAPVARVRLVRR